MKKLHSYFKQYEILFIIISIFIGYYYINPLVQKPILDRDQITLNAKGMHNAATLPILRPLWKYNNQSSYFIHPGVKEPAKGIFIFHNSFLLQFHFSIQKESPCGNIEYIVKKNNKEIKRNVVTTKSSFILNLNVDKNDKIEIIADKHGDTCGDWGLLYIYKINTMYKIENFLIPFLWSLLFLFLLFKGHKYIVILTYIAFLFTIFAEKLNFGLMFFETIGTYTLFYFALSFLLVLIYQEFKFAKKIKLSTIFGFAIMSFVYLIPLAFIIYILNTGHEVTSEVMFAIFQTDKSEAMEYISDSVATKYILLLTIFFIVLAIILFIQEKVKVKKINRLLLLFIIPLLFGLFIKGFSYLRLPAFIDKEYNEYQTELERFTRFQRKRKANLIDFNATKKEENETYVVVIGESLNKYHMGLYGYFRKNTPLLTKQLENDLLVFNNAYPNYLLTMQSLSFALTEANQYNHKKYYNSLSILNILNKAQFETYWITNQVFLGAHDNIVAVLGKGAKHPIPLNYNHGGEAVTARDGKAIRVLEKLLKEKSSKNKVVFIHLMGSHVKYTYRYPHDKFTKYDKLSEIAYGKFSNDERINEYDNSVYYNDYVVANILQVLQKHRGVSGFLYFSDHGEDVLRHLKHNPNDPKPIMSQIPMIAWFSEEYKNRYPQKYSTLKSNINKLFSNDLIDTTLLGIANVKTEKYNANYDLSSKKYKLTPSEALELHGRDHYVNDTNYIYWRNINSKYLREMDLKDTVVPKHVNLIGKYAEAQNNGFKAFALDISCDDTSGALYIGTQNTRIQSTFKDYLAEIPLSSIDKLYISLANINKNNYNRIINELENLDIQYHLKKRTVIIFETAKVDISILKKKGWKLSYRLNDQKIFNFKTQTSDRDKLLIWLQNNKIDSLTFNEKSYSYVKTYLEPNFDEKINYNIFHSTLSLKNEKFKNNLESSRIYQDNLVKTLFVDYPSLYEL